jgi:hypothetical protein
VVCPQCGGIVYEAGDAFKAPKMKNVKAWEKLRTLFESGFKFNRDSGSPFNETPETVNNSPDFKSKSGLKSLFQLQARKRKRYAHKIRNN